jgi:hypothetical protein
VVFIFATTELHKVPATIKSRCQQFAFRLIAIETIQEILKNVCADMNLEAEDEALFWIARESTGSLRDAFTLFDQVVSFSAGHIRTALIREKLGILGLEKLNALAEACAANDTAGALSQIDEILASGVAIEQFVIDMASYYRSLLLLKNGITRESLLGYSPRRFSAMALERLDSIRLEQALSLLLACYRDIRYSVSPRFELEAAVSKLAWLTRWVSPPELSAALGAARNVLGGGLPPAAGGGGLGNNPPLSGAGSALSGGPIAAGGESRPAAEGALTRDSPAAGTVPQKTPGPGAADSPMQFGATGSLSEDFKRLLASRKNRSLGGPAAEAGTAHAGGGGIWPAADQDEPDDDAPVWSRFTGTMEPEAVNPPEAAAPAGTGGPGYEPENQADFVPGGPEPDIAPQAQRVLRVFPGTIIKTSGGDNEHQSF